MARTEVRGGQILDATVSLTADVTGVLPVANGGNGQATLPRLDQSAAPTGSVSLNSQKITSLADPTSPQDAATKAYADKTGVVTFRVTAGPLTNINTASPGATIDGVSMVAGDTVLLVGQTTASQNGVWIWNGSAVAMTRHTTYPAGSTSAIFPNQLFSTLEGTAWADTIWLVTNSGTITIGTTSLTFTYIAASSTDRDRTNHTGTQAQSTVTSLVSDLALKAPLADPIFTGVTRVDGAFREPFPGVANTGAITLTTSSAVNQMCDATSASFNVTLPSTTNSGQEFLIKKLDGTVNTVTVLGTIDGQTNIVLRNRYDWIKVISSLNGGTWFIVAGNADTDWISYTPTIVGSTSPTLSCRYIRLAPKFIQVELDITLTAAVTTTLTASLPSTSATPIRHNLGGATLYDVSSGAERHAWARLGSSTIVQFSYEQTNAQVLTAATVPWTWASGDKIMSVFQYREA